MVWLNMLAISLCPPGMAYVCRCGYSSDEAVTAVEDVAHASTQYLLRACGWDGAGQPGQGTVHLEGESGPTVSPKSPEMLRSSRSADDVICDYG